MGRILPALMLGVLTLLPSFAAAQQFDYPARQRMEAAVARLSDPGTVDDLAAEARAVMVGVGLPWRAAVRPETRVTAFEPAAGAVIELVDIRLLLTQIAIQAGARDHHALLRAQGNRDRDVILLRGGSVALPDLFTLSRGTPAQDFVTRTPAGVMLTRPLAIWSDAGLTLAAADHLILDRPSGSFVANLGRLDINGGSIAGTIGANGGEADFRPFVLTAGRGGLTAQAADFRNLGFGSSPVFGGIAIVNNGLVLPGLSSIIADSDITDVATLALIGTTGAVLSGNRIAGSDAAAILISRAKDSKVSGNRLTALTGPQAIRVTAAASQVRIDSNFVSGTARMGILVDRESLDVTVTQNLISGSVTTGIGVDGANCILIGYNLVAGNGGTGISLTDTDEATVANNAILMNHGSGVLVRDQSPVALVRLTGNVLVANRDGLRGATPGNVRLRDNDLNGQMPRLFAGDLAPLTVGWLRKRRDAIPLTPGAPTRSECAQQGKG